MQAAVAFLVFLLDGSFCFLLVPIFDVPAP